MKWFLGVLFLCAVKSLYCKSFEFSQQDDSKEVNKFLGKILHADKFNELADRIADRAVKKMNDYQKPQLTAKLDTNDGIYRSKMKKSLHEDTNYSFEKSRVHAKHKHGKIDVDAVLKKTVLPLNDLKLRYKYLKNKHSKAALRNKEKDKDNEDASFQERNPNANFNEENKGDRNLPPDYNKLAHDIQLDFDENIKTMSNENFKNPYGDGETVSWDKKHTKFTRDRKFISEIELDENTSKEKDKTPSKSTRTEGNKQFAIVESPDYKEYHEQLANMQPPL